MRVCSLGSGNNTASVWDLISSGAAHVTAVENEALCVKMIHKVMRNNGRKRNVTRLDVIKKCSLRTYGHTVYCYLSKIIIFPPTCVFSFVVFVWLLQCFPLAMVWPVL